MARNNITVNVLANTRNLTSGIRSAAQQTQQGLRGIAQSARQHVGQALTSLRELAGPAALGAGAALGAALVVGIGQAMEKSKITSRLEAQLGATPAVAKKVGKVAGELYSDAISTDFQQAADGIRAVMTAGLVPPGASIKQIKSIATNALDLANVFEVDLGQATNAVGQMMKTGLAKNGKEAFDVLTRGFQTMGPRADDLLDTFNEYSTQFRQMGLSAIDATGILSQGMKAGARDTDVVADSLKEFVLIAQGGGEKVDAAFKAVGLNGKEMQKVFVEGGPKAKLALDKVFDGLRKIKDPADRNAAALALFGTKSEDMQRALMAIDPSEAVSDLGKVGGAADDMGKTLRDNAATKIEQFKRKVETALVKFIADKVLPALEKFATWASENKDFLKPLAIGLTALAVALGLAAAAQWAMNIAMLANPVGLVVLAIAGLVAILAVAWVKSEWFRDKVTGAFEAIKTKVAPIIEEIKLLVGAFVQRVQEFWDRHGEGIMESVSRAWEGIQQYVGGALQTLKGLIQIVTGLISGDWEKVWTGIKNVFGGIWEQIQGLFKLFTGAIGVQLKVFLGGIKDAWNSSWQKVKDIANTVWISVRTLIVNKLIEIANSISTKLSAIKGAWNGAWSAVKSYLSTTWEGIKQRVISGIANVMSQVSGIRGRVTGALSGAGSWLYSAGANLMRGMVNGILSMAGNLASQARQVVSNAVSAAKNALGIHSPSRVFAEIGKYTIQGLVKGLEKVAPVKRAGAGLGDTLTASFDSSLTAKPTYSYAGIGAGPATVEINVNVPVSADPVATGREVDKVLKAFYRVNGVRA
ncbi:phage tail tape measure protein [Streptomyces sp. NBC_01571]|uniref:phage tail tape measure protein n=1 Tax=Streptomyces sp. NBC_01571 TaxID=2975883 RepID=UPI002253CB3C|nr:phage tail tape measure protein [Streptomyces sp. NBC_01571]MCX4577940.1 phage tail tape measure protein [Streptomyces sp. NBC_01571]